MEFKFAHIADIHAKDSDWDEISKCLNNTQRICREQKIDFTVLAGDLWDHKLWSHSESFRGTVDWVVRMAEHGPVYLIYGTPGHDTPNGHAIFKHIESKHPIHVIEEVSTLDIHIDKKKVATLAALPHISIPAQGNLDQTMEVRREALRRYIGMLKEGCDENVASIFTSHGAVIGCVIPQGTDGYEISPIDLQSFTYSALGHIHPKDQKLPENMQYSGSLWHTETGDVSEKGFYIVSIHDKELVQKDFFNAGSHPVIKFDGHFTEAGIQLPNSDVVNLAKVRFTIYIPARIRDAFNAKEIEQEILKRGAVSCKIIPRVLLEEIDVVDFGYTREVKPGDWEDKFRVYCDSVDLEISDRLIEKVVKLIKEVENEQTV